MNLLFIKKNKGITLIELVIALAISSILVAAIYRTFLGQQKTYVVQEQVVDMQQNTRVAINRMMREIRMAGFGNVSSVLPFNAIGGPFPNIINPTNNSNNVGQNDDQITIIGAFEQVSTLSTEAAFGSDTITLNGNGGEFDTGNRRYICIGGIETKTVTNVAGNTITFTPSLVNTHRVGTPVFKVKAITYRLDWDNNNMPVLRRDDRTDNLLGQPVAENIENLQFRYILEDETETDLPVTPANIRMVRVTITARTNLADPDYRGGAGGFRRRTIASNIQIRNMELSP